MNKKARLNILFFLLLICISATFSQAQQANSLSEQNISLENKALIKEYLEVTGGRESINKNLDAVFANLNNALPMIISTTIEQNIDLTTLQKTEILKGLPEMVERLNKKFRDGLNQELDIAKLVEDVNYPLLNKFFTEDELKDLIVFFKSPTGQKAIAIQPQLYADAASRMNAVLIPIIQKIMKRTTDEEITETVKKTKRNK